MLFVYGRTDGPGMEAMLGPALTQERRNQLSALLDDEKLLRATFPQVADYLSTAPTLAGTGDSQADAAFDIRLLHFMTGDASISKNPYWDIVAPSVFEQGGRRVVNGGNPEGSAQLALAQMVLQAAYSYGIPSPETIDWMREFCGDRPVFELGAGRGYWAAQLSRAGQAVYAYELEPPDRVDNISFPRVTGQEAVWHPVSSLADMSFDHRSDQVLFLCWPPGWENPMASDALSAFEASGGERLVYIGEPRGGKTGDGAFFDALADRWRLETTDSRFVSWWNLDDMAQGWVRQ